MDRRAIYASEQMLTIHCLADDVSLPDRTGDYTSSVDYLLNQLLISSTTMAGERQGLCRLHNPIGGHVSGLINHQCKDHGGVS